MRFIRSLFQHRGQIQTHQTPAPVGNIMNGSWFLTNPKAKSTLHPWNKLHKVLSLCHINSSQVSKHAFLFARHTYSTHAFAHTLVCWKFQTSCEYHHRGSIIIILGKNLLHAAITRARQALPYRATALMLWHFLSTNLSCDRIQTGQACIWMSMRCCFFVDYKCTCY